MVGMRLLTHSCTRGLKFSLSFYRPVQEPDAKRNRSHHSWPGQEASVIMVTQKWTRRPTGGFISFHGLVFDLTTSHIFEQLRTEVLTDRGV